MAGVGHNKGPSMEPGFAYCKHLWTKARRDLLPTLPIEIIRMRVRRAKELGLDYKTYAGVRASTGRDVVGFLFSSNALRVDRKVVTLPADRAAIVEQIIACRKFALVHAPADPHAVQVANPVIDAVDAAPSFAATWSEMCDIVKRVIRDQKLPADGILVIGDTYLEREWSDAGRTAGFLPAARYFKEMSL